MAELKTFGQHTPHGRQLLLLIAGGGILGLALAVRSRNAAAAAASTSASAMPAQSGEFLSAVRGAQAQIIGLTAMNALQSKMADYQFQTTYAQLPASQRTCIPWAEWNKLQAKDKKALYQQAKMGKTILLPQGPGMCFLPTSIGTQGHQPITTTQVDNGLFSSGGSIRGPAGSYSPNLNAVQQPAIGGILSSIIQAASAYLGGGGGGAPIQRGSLGTYYGPGTVPPGYS